MRNAPLLGNPWNDMRERESTRTADRYQVRSGTISKRPALTEVTQCKTGIAGLERVPFASDGSLAAEVEFRYLEQGGFAPWLAS